MSDQKTEQLLETVAGLSFNDLELAPEVLRAVRDAGYTHPTPIQQQAIPLALAGRDPSSVPRTATRQRGRAPRPPRTNPSSRARKDTQKVARRRQPRLPFAAAAPRGGQAPEGRRQHR